MDMMEKSPKKGFYMSKKAVLGWLFLVAVLLVAEGLLVGLVGRPTCNNEVVDNDIKTTLPPKVTTTGRNPVFTTPPPSGDIWYNSRLPLSLIPMHYNVDLRPVLEKDPVSDLYIFYGSSSVQYQCNVSTEYVMLHSIMLNYTDDFELMDETAGEMIDITDWMFFSLNSYLVITTSKPCTKGNIYKLTTNNFYGELGDDLDGIYRSEYDNAMGDHRVIAVSQMETTGARQTFPCFDEPGFKATFDITLRFRKDLNYYAISNMPPLFNETTMIDGVEWTATHFNTSPIMSTYLIAVSVCDFEYDEAFTENGTQTRIYARDVPVRNNEVIYAADVSPKILDVYAKHFSVAYPLPKSDQMAVPDFGAGAMENWGLVLYREVYLLYDVNISSVFDQYAIAQVIGHELAHQWFGNLVTAAWWNEIWLNEGFASFVQYIGVNGVHPTWRTDELFILEDFQVALYADDSSGSHPLVHPQGYFSSVTYSKGASFLRMVESFMGEEKFTNALTKYLNGLAYGSATHNDLFQYWIAEIENDFAFRNIPLQKVFESWTLQMGFPLLTVKHNASNQITISQEYFLINPDDSPVDTPGSETYKYKWYVPIKFKYASEIYMSQDATNNIWMYPENDIIFSNNASEDYLLANLNAVGFYRVQYDESMMKKIIETLKSATFKNIPPQNRAQLIDDAFAISRSGRLSVDVPLDVSSYLYQDIEYIPWATFLNSLTYFERMLGRSVIYGDFSKYVVDMVVPSIYNHYGWDDSNTSVDLLIERMTRSIAIEAACEYGYQECIANASMLYRAWMNDPTQLISSTYRTDVYCTAIRAGGVEEWDFAWQQYLTVDSAQHKTSLRYAMSCSKESWILNRYIQYTLDPSKVRGQDVSSTLSYIGGQEYGKYVAWSFAHNNWDLLMSTVGGSTSSLLSAATRRFSTDFDLSLIESLRTVAGPIWTSTFNSYKNSVMINKAWREENEPKIADYLGVTLTTVRSKPTKHIIPLPETTIEHPKRFHKRF